MFDTVLSVMDHYNFDQGALAFSQGDWLARSANNSYSPLYKYFLGVIYYIFGRNFYAIYSIQFVMGALASVLVYLIARESFGARVAMLAYLGFALYTTEIVYEGTILRVSFITFLGLLSCYLLMRLQSARLSSGKLVLAALALSLFFQSRPNTILCLPFVVYYLHRTVFLREASVERMRYWAAFAGTLVISFLPLLAQAYIVHGRFVFFDASGPVAFIAGNFISYSGFGFQPGVVATFERNHAMEYGAVITAWLGQILEHPLEFAALYLRKLYYFFNDLEAPSNISVYLYRESSILLPFLLNHFALYSALGLIGIALAIKNKKDVFLLHGFAAGMILSVVLFHIVARFRVPAAPYLIIFAAYALDSVVEWLRQKRFVTVWGTVLLAGVLLYVFRIPGNANPVRQMDFCNFGIAYFKNEPRFDLAKAEGYGRECYNVEVGSGADPVYGRTLLTTIYNLYALYLWQEGREFGAWKALERSYLVHPLSSASFRILARMELINQRDREGIRILRAGIAAHPEDKLLYKRLTQVLMRDGAGPARILPGLKGWLAMETDALTANILREQIKRQNQFKETEPPQNAVTVEVAEALVTAGRLKEAASAYELLNASNDFDSGRFLKQGLMLLQLDRLQEAMEAFYEGLLIHPQDAEIHQRLADFYLSTNRPVFAWIHLTRYRESAHSEDPGTQRIWAALRKQLRLLTIEPLIPPLSKGENSKVFAVFKTTMQMKKK